MTVVGLCGNIRQEPTRIKRFVLRIQGGKKDAKRIRNQKEMCEIGKRVYNRGMVAANDGNFSVRISENEVLCTPTGVSKGFMTPDYICKVDLDGNVLQANKGFRRFF